MKAKHLKLFGLLAGLALLLLLGACNGEVGETQRDSQSVELGDVDSVRVEMTMNAGELSLSGGAVGVMDSEFIYNVAAWQPQVSYDRVDRQGLLVIDQTPIHIDTSDIWQMLFQGAIFQEFRNEWQVQLSDQVPLTLNVTLGAGKSHLDLAGLTLTELNLTLGAGETNVDLSEVHSRDLQVNISGGAGEIEVRLPQDIGVQIEVEHGPGEVNEYGLKRKGKAYVNDALGESEATIEINIQAGFGSIRLVED